MTDGTKVLSNLWDRVTEPEALLFHDDLTVPIGRLQWLINVLRILQDVAPAVCLIRASRGDLEQTGTGFRIADDLLLTNWHVATIRGLPAANISAEFGFDDDGAGGGRESTAVECHCLPAAAEQADDWAALRVRTQMGASVPAIKLSNAAVPIIGQPAFIVQHPAGQRKRVAYARNQITDVTERVVQYLSDTQGGSSGSPVLDDQGRLVALHHAGGRPQEVAGRPPLRKNEGIRIDRVCEGLAQSGLAVS
jgi:hypothetical protein